jgi:hypothetical protein
MALFRSILWRPRRARPERWFNCDLAATSKRIPKLGSQKMQAGDLDAQPEQEGSGNSSKAPSDPSFRLALMLSGH